MIFIVEYILLLNLDLCIKTKVEKCYNIIKLIGVELFVYYNNEQYHIRRFFYNYSKKLKIINSFFLLKISSYLPSLLLFYLTVDIIISLKCLFSSYNMLINWLVK